MSKSDTTEVKFCRWKMDDLEAGYWDTECKQAFEVTTGTPLENKMVFCCYCGKKLVESYAA